MDNEKRNPIDFRSRGQRTFGSGSTRKCESANEIIFRTKPSVVEIENMTKEVEHHKAHKVYKELVCQNTEGHDAVSKLRNVKQLQNARAKVQNDIRWSKDTIVNTHELAYAHPDFIWHITTLPDLTVLCGEQEMIDLLQDIALTKDNRVTLHSFFFQPRSKMVM